VKRTELLELERVVESISACESDDYRSYWTLNIRQVAGRTAEDAGMTLGTSASFALSVDYVRRAIRFKLAIYRRRILQKYLQGVAT
jgi:hypothetical protein